MTKNIVRKAIGIIMVASLLIAIVPQALYPIQVAASRSEGNILYDPFEGTTLGEIKMVGQELTVSFAPSGDNGTGFDMGQSVYFDVGETSEFGGYILYGTEGQPSPFVTNPGTLELWVRADNWVSPSDRRDILSTHSGINEGIDLYLVGDKLELSLSGETTIMYDTSGLDTGWHHFAIAWDGTGASLYIDGEPIGDGGGFTSTHNRLILWSLFGGLTGYVDELASYNYKKTETQIKEDFEAESSPHYKLPEPPIADANGPYTGAEGSPIILDGSSSSDPDGDDTIVTYEWDLDDDGVFDDASGAKTSYTWDDDFTGDIGLKVTDSDNLSATATTTANISNVAPTVEAGANQTVIQDDIVNFSGSFTDPGEDSHTIDWDFGEGMPANETLTPTHVYPSSGTYIVTLTVTDDDGGAGIDTLQVTVIASSSQAPTADASGSYTGTEGSPIILDGSSSSDLDGTIVTYEWDLDDDGAFDDASGATTSYTWDDDFAGNIGLEVTDSDGLSATATATVNISNVAPTVGAGANQTVIQGDIVSFSGSFTDPGEDSHAIDWDFGEGSTANETPTPTHVYPSSGTYIVTLTVTDDDGGAGIDTLQVTVIASTDSARAMLGFQIEKAKIEVSKGKVSVKGAFELDPSGDGVDISEEVVVIMGLLSETIPGGTMVDKKDKWEYRQPRGVEGIIKKMKIDWKKGKFDFSIDKAGLSELTDPDNVTISLQIGDDFGQTTIAMVITYDYSMPK